MNYRNRSERSLSNELVLAAVKRRFAALLIDCVIIILLYICVLVLFSSIFHISDWNVNVKSISEVDIETDRNTNSMIVLLKIIFGFLPVIYFTFILYFFKGQTIGKYLLRLKVISLYHERLGLWHCFERSLGYFTSALEGGFGFIQAIWNPNRMALHDKIGETIVIYLPRKRSK